MDSYLDSKDGHIFLSSAGLFHRAATTLRDKKESSLLDDFAARVRPQLVRFMKPTSHSTGQEFQVCLLVKSMRKFIYLLRANVFCFLFSVAFRWTARNSTSLSLYLPQVQLLKFIVSVDGRHWLAAFSPDTSSPLNAVAASSKRKAGEDVVAGGGTSSSSSGVGLFALRTKDSSSLKRWKLRALCHLAEAPTPSDDGGEASANLVGDSN